MRIEQYFLITDYSLWEVILNGDSLVPTRIVEGVAQPVAPTTVEQKLARKNELKARGVAQPVAPTTIEQKLARKNELKARELMLLSESRGCQSNIDAARLKLKLFKNITTAEDITK
nr:hypothetical protein [Tanacetum cinerariifolium]